MSKSQLVPCPGGCGETVHQSADVCPRCGFRAETANFEALLGSLSTICSILVGFGLAALITLAVDKEALQDPWIAWTAALWLVSSVLLLFVLVLTEFIRRSDLGTSRITMSQEEDQLIWRRCEQLLVAFTLALLGILVGVILMSFHFGGGHGVAACVATAFGFIMLVRTLR